MFNKAMNKLSVLVVLCFVSTLAVAFDDPTKPSSFQQSSKPQELKLESILYGDARRVAIINGQVLAEGDSIGSKKIINIGRDSVSLASDEGNLILTLKHSSIRQVK